LLGRYTPAEKGAESARVMTEVRTKSWLGRKPFSVANIKLTG
jgi:hypothetical protein